MHTIYTYHTKGVRERDITYINYIVQVSVLIWYSIWAFRINNNNRDMA